MKWISVEDAMPGYNDQVAVSDGGNVAIGASYLFDEWTITHWMPLPEIPEAEE